jgi:hypothetical protein
MNGREQGCQHTTSQTLLEGSVPPYPPEEILQSRHDDISHNSTLCGVRYKGLDELGETMSSTKAIHTFPESCNIINADNTIELSQFC